MPDTDQATDRAADLRDRIEADLADAVAASVRRFLNRLRRAAGRNPEAVVAAATDWLTLGETMGWWADEVDQELMVRIGQAWQQANRGRGVAATSLDQAGPFLAQVRDRLVRGLEPGLPEDAFNRIRETLTQSVAQGWSHSALQRRIAEELSWSTDKQYWQQQLGRADDELDRILDGIGDRGDPVREMYRRADPDGLVQALQADRSHAILQIEREDSWWQVRAERIARTESTAAYNHGALQALAEEGFTHKQWLAAEDNRTRPSHAEADGQTVPLEQGFIVGGYTMMMPGDPNAPGRETINCRCTVVGAEATEPESPPPEPPPDETTGGPVPGGAGGIALDWGPSPLFSDDGAGTARISGGNARTRQQLREELALAYRHLPPRLAERFLPAELRVLTRKANWWGRVRYFPGQPAQRLEVSGSWSSATAAEVADLIADGWWTPSNRSGSQATVDHEVGHVIDLILSRTAGPSYEADRRALITSYGSQATQRIRPRYVAGELSRYGARNDREFIAEAWREYTGSDQPRPKATEIGRMMERHMQDVERRIERGEL